MKKLPLLVLASVLFIACNNNKVRYTQNSPEIDTFKKVIDDYDKHNWKNMVTYYADTAKILNNTTDNGVKSIAEEIARNKEDAKLFTWKFTDSEYEMVVTDKEQTWVNFWGLWKGKLKSNNKTYEIPVHITARFVDGKIVRELGYWDASDIAKDFQKMEDDNKYLSEKDKIIQQSINNMINAWNTNSSSLLESNTVKNIVRTTNGIKQASNQKEYKTVINSFHSAFPDLKVTLDDTAIKGNKAYLNWTFTGTNKGEFNGNAATNKKVKLHGVGVVSFNADGKQTHDDAYFDNLVLFQQLGYSMPKLNN
jgi:predicted ester cyclase